MDFQIGWFLRSDFLLKHNNAKRSFWAGPTGPTYSQGVTTKSVTPKSSMKREASFAMRENNRDIEIIT